MSGRVLVPIDDSEPARAALREVIETFDAAEVVALHVVEPTASSYGMEGAAAGSVVESEKEAGRELLAEAEETAAERGAEIETAIEVGRPVPTIVDYAAERDVDHVVMGSHGRSGLSRILVGSVAEGVIREAPVTVTVAREAGTDLE
ncbi:universal stress protein [Halovivax sp.]|uniref:universal stress protein n=1 Tax=Halovivax sp. TaxID=1935978 RepID=UPI0025C23208|nr:universal stress protein [Halovivax sp.]